MDRKTFSFKITNLDFAGRTVEGYANVFGVTDLVGDIVHPGAFGKTLVERGGKIKFLWQHDTTEPLGRIMEMQEDAHGLYMKAIISDTSRGRDALALLRDGAVDSFSIGYDSIKGGTDYTKDPVTGETVRNLREVKLYEVSLVTIPANELATVTALKQRHSDAAKPSEGKPYGIFASGEQHCIYKIDADGERMGESLGCHDTEDEAVAQMRAMMANEKDADTSVDKAMDEDYMAGMEALMERMEEMMGMMRDMMGGEKPEKGEKSGRRVRRDKVELLRQLSEITRELMTWADYDDAESEEDEDNGIKSDAQPTNEQAGPGTPPTSQKDYARLIEIETAELDMYL